MAQATILAVGTTAATSTDVTVAAGASASIGIFATSAEPPWDCSANVMMDTPSGDIHVARLERNNPVVVANGPGTFRVVRPVQPTTDIGVFSET